MGGTRDDDQPTLLDVEPIEFVPPEATPMNLGIKGYPFKKGRAASDTHADPETSPSSLAQPSPRIVRNRRPVAVPSQILAPELRLQSLAAALTHIPADKSRKGLLTQFDAKFSECRLLATGGVSSNG